MASRKLVPSLGTCLSCMTLSPSSVGVKGGPEAIGPIPYFKASKVAERSLTVSLSFVEAMLQAQPIALEYTLQRKTS